MTIFGWILFGFVVGLIARAIMPGRDSMGFVGTTFLGIVGALVAGWFGQAMGWYAPDQGAGFISATIGAVAVLAIYYAVVGRRARRRLTKSAS
jgi:uncharacterized membrane protein YeaQ/YmgE (transglycosylase-associated protein family)